MPSVRLSLFCSLGPQTSKLHVYMPRDGSASID